MDSKTNLENLLRSGGLKAEPPDCTECEGLMRSGKDRLRDAGTAQLSFSSRFDLAYNAAHAIALTAYAYKVIALTNAIWSFNAWFTPPRRARWK